MKTNLILLLSIMTIILSSCGVTNDKSASVSQLQDANMKTVALNVVEDIVFQGNQNYEIILGKSKDAPTICGNFKTKLDGKKLIITTDENNASSIVLINADILPNIISNGSGNLKFTGRTKRATIYSNGSGDVNAEKFKVNILTFYSNGSGDSKVYASSQANVFLDGSGNVVVKGSPKLVNRMGNFAYNIK